MSYVMFSRILSCYFFHVPLFSVSCHFLNLSLTFSKKLKCFLIACVHSLSRFHLWKYCLSFFYFLQCCHSGITLGGLSHVRLSPPEELCTLLPHSLSPKTTFFKSVTSLNLFPVVFCWNSAWFHVSQTIFHLIYAFCALVTLVCFLTLGCSYFCAFIHVAPFFQAPFIFL